VQIVLAKQSLLSPNTSLKLYHSHTAIAMPTARAMLLVASAAHDAGTIRLHSTSDVADAVTLGGCQ